jgi:hypothetical protein
MKKIFVLLNLFVAGFCFGQMSQISGYSSYTIESDGEYTIAQGIPFGMSGVLFVDDTLGMGTYANFFYLPKVLGAVTDADDTVFGGVIKNGGDNILFEFDS